MTAPPPASAAAPTVASTITGMADQPAPVRLYHPPAPHRREFGEGTPPPMRPPGRGGRAADLPIDAWTDQGSDQTPGTDAALLDTLPDPPDDPPTTLPGPGNEGTTNPDTLNPEATDG